MLAFAKNQIGKPFSNMGMARSLIFPRTTTGNTYYCAELVASILKQGGLMYAAHPCSNCLALSLAIVLCTRAHTLLLEHFNCQFVKARTTPPAPQLVFVVDVVCSDNGRGTATSFIESSMHTLYFVPFNPVSPG